MMKEMSDIDFRRTDEGIPAFMTIVMMAFSYSITEGIAFGFVTYALCKIFAKKFSDINIAVATLSVLFLAHILLPGF
jgi:AGZA family xanthine/uracil permease-like MFS transporter